MSSQARHFAFMLGIASALSISASTANANMNYPADNTIKNKTDAANATLTPEDQMRGSAQDVETTRLIRSELVKDDTLSTNAKNIKVITINDVVTLRGIVNSDIEKNNVEKKAKDVAGNRKVDNQLSVSGASAY